MDLRFLEILASIAGVAMSFATYPQAIEIFKKKNSNGVSLATYLIFFIGSMIWVVYGVIIWNKPILLGYVPGVIGNFLVLAAIFKYPKNDKS